MTSVPHSQRAVMPGEQVIPQAAGYSEVFYGDHRSKSQSRSRLSSSGSRSYESRACFHCGKKGHIKSECRRFKGLCLVCGASDHRISSCPKRRTLSSDRSQLGSKREGRPARQVTFSVDSGNNETVTNEVPEKTPLNSRALRGPGASYQS